MHKSMCLDDWHSAADPKKCKTTPPHQSVKAFHVSNLGMQHSEPTFHPPTTPPLPLPFPQLQSCCSYAVSAEQQLRNLGEGEGEGGWAAAAAFLILKPPPTPPNFLGPCCGPSPFAPWALASALPSACSLRTSRASYLLGINEPPSWQLNSAGAENTSRVS